MNVQQFRRQRERRWRKLEKLTTSSLTFESSPELDEFIRLYQETSSDLAYAKTYFPADPLTSYLNSLIVTAYPRMYQKKRGGSQNLFAFLRRAFPQLFRSYFSYILVAALISLFGALYGYILVYQSPVNAYHLLPASFVHQFQPSKAGPHAVNAPIMSTLIMTHNMLVALEAFVGGATLGLFTIYALWQNGLILGILAAVFQRAGRSVVFWSLIVPHGVTELTAIFVAGGAGLMFARYLAAPGQFTRGKAIEYGGKRAVLLFLGTVPMLAVAGTIEGFVTPSSAPDWVKFGTAIITLLFWILYFGWAGRSADAQPGSSTFSDSASISGADKPLPYPPPHRKAGIPRR
ncbi:stage II sporulation protein M [Alicyclobacillus sp. SO9]|uniref:stage II sporulation protein M n=1 Tax=Alicyclobacillus sp. SO9 TaxID=2665646 RepID=UPI0018E8DF7B|nr:stage II sporulation protein M [Alicyclobacillus sp. SO9]QQE77770.1 stage II sporulation protein M [Alicyclobacillus sp. SO9]